MAKILLGTTAVRWFRRALILVACALTPTCTINPQTEPPSLKPPGAGGIMAGSGGHFTEGGGVTGTGARSGGGGSPAASGGSVGRGGMSSPDAGVSGGAPGAGGASGAAGTGTYRDAGAADATQPPPADGGATDSGDAGGDASPEDGGAIDAGTDR